MASPNNNNMFIEEGGLQATNVCRDFNENHDDDGRPKRTGTVLTATAHIITTVMGAGVLSLAWSVAQLGWIVGLGVLGVFAIITYTTSTYLADCYRSPDPITGKRNYTYKEVVRTTLGGKKVQLCALAQYTYLICVTIGYAITTCVSMAAVKRSNCFHKNGHHANCNASTTPFMIIFACVQMLLSQIPNFSKLTGLSIVAAIMSFTYSFVGLGLSVAKVIDAGVASTTLTGVVVGVDVMTTADKIWRCFQAIGNMASAYAYVTVGIEIQDTLKSPPAENKPMKKASLIAISITTVFNLLCGGIGYAAFGNNAPGNFLTGFGFYEPFWLIDFANVCIAVHLVAAYQVLGQPVFCFVETWCKKRWPENKFINREYPIGVPFGSGVYHANWFRLVWRTCYVMLTVLVAMIFPFFNDVLALLGAISFWPLGVYFPVELHIAQAKVPKYSPKWIGLKMLSYACLVVSLMAAVGSIQGLVVDVKKYQPLKAFGG